MNNVTVITKSLISSVEQHLNFHRVTSRLAILQTARKNPVFNTSLPVNQPVILLGTLQYST